jgi:hypothetical protein
VLYCLFFQNFKNYIEWFFSHNQRKFKMAKALSFFSSVLLFHFNDPFKPQNFIRFISKLTELLWPIHVSQTFCCLLTGILNFIKIVQSTEKHHYHQLTSERRCRSIMAVFGFGQCGWLPSPKKPKKKVRKLNCNQFSAHKPDFYIHKC